MKIAMTVIKQNIAVNASREEDSKLKPINKNWRKEKDRAKQKKKNGEKK